VEGSLPGRPRTFTGSPDRTSDSDQVRGRTSRPRGRVVGKEGGSGSGRQVGSPDPTSDSDQVRVRTSRPRGRVVGKEGGNGSRRQVRGPNARCRREPGPDVVLLTTRGRTSGLRGRVVGKGGERQWKAVYRAGRAPSPGVLIGRRTTYDPRSDLARLRGRVVGLRSGPRSDFPDLVAAALSPWLGKSQDSGRGRTS
jgi:hypothetical protein